MMTLPTRIGSRAGLTAEQTVVADDEVRPILNEMADADYDPATEAEVARTARVGSCLVLIVG